jgi:hypothetical protein
MIALYKTTSDATEMANMVVGLELQFYTSVFQCVAIVV